MDCVLLDMKIPGMDGIEILRRLKEVSEVSLFYDDSIRRIDVVQEALELGAIRYFTKPFDIFEVRDEVNKALQV